MEKVAIGDTVDGGVDGKGEEKEGGDVFKPAQLVWYDTMKQIGHTVC